MKVEQAFTVARPSDDVWAFFQDIPNVATCMPGAEMTGEKAPGVYGGKISLKLGPFQETANILIGEFVTRLEERLAPPAQAGQAAPPPETRAETRSGQLSVSRLVLLTLRAWVARLFRRPA